MISDEKHTPDPESDGSQDTTDDINDSAYVSDLPGIIGTIDVLVARVEAVLLAAGVMLMALNTIINVFSRIIGRTIFFTEELNQILIILITFAGISYAARHGRHIRMSAFFDAMPFRQRKILMIIISVLTAAMMFLLAWYSMIYLIDQKSNGDTLPGLSIPRWWIIVWVPVGFLLTAIQYGLTTIKNLIDKDIWLSASTLEGYGNDVEEEV